MQMEKFTLRVRSYHKNEDDLELRLNRLRIDRSSYDCESILSLQVSHLLLMDGVFKFCNETFKPLLATERNTISEILFIQRHPTTKIDVANREITLNLDKIAINWKPDTLLRFRDWTRKLSGLPEKSNYEE